MGSVRGEDLDTRSMRIGELARATGVGTKALRYYDEIGLLRPAGRTAAGYRIYDAVAEARVQFIRAAQELGLSLTDIRGILEISDGGGAPCHHVLAVVDRDLARIDVQLKRLRNLRRDLHAARARIDKALADGNLKLGQGCRCLAS